MEKKKGFLSALKDEVIRGLSPSRSRPKSPGRSSSPFSTLLRRRKNQEALADPLVPGSGLLRPPVMALAPLMEGPDNEGFDWSDGKKERWGRWKKGHISRAPSITWPAASSSACRRSDLRVLLGVMGAPLAPVHVSSADPLPHLSIKDTPIETSSGQYILQQFTAASGGQRLQDSIRNAYAMGRLKMVASEVETAMKVTKSRSMSHAAELGKFVLWQMQPDMWYVELVVGGNKVHAGCNGKLVWRHTPWLGAHTAKGPVRPLRRTLQGLDPRTTAIMFADARCIGEKVVNGDECFILKLSADPQTLKARSQGPVEIIRHILFGYFSQRTGLLVQIEDSHLTRIQSNGGDALYWEMTFSSFLDDYRPVEGMLIAHSGRSVVTLFRFGEMAMSHYMTRMEEVWMIEEVAFNVPGLSVDCFIPPTELRSGSMKETCGISHGERGETMVAGELHSKITAQDDLITTHGRLKTTNW